MQRQVVQRQRRRQGGRRHRTAEGSRALTHRQMHATVGGTAQRSGGCAQDIAALAAARQGGSNSALTGTARSRHESRALTATALARRW